MALEYELLLRLFLAVILGGLIGFERGINHDAGLRTHIILCLGSASVMVLSEALVVKYDIDSEIMRMAAQVVSGVGFLGAGSIVIDGNRVRGITTAAGLWTTACVGLVVGAGYYLIAFTIVILMLCSMLGLKSLKKKLRVEGTVYNVRLEAESAVMIQEVFEKLVSESVHISSMKVEDTDTGTFIDLEIKIPRRVNVEDVMQDLCRCCIVREFTVA